MGSSHSTIINKIDTRIDLSDAVLLKQIKNCEIYYVDLSYNKVFKDQYDIFDEILYEKQRPINSDRAAKISEAIESDSSHHWTITLGFVRGCSLKLLDGQHRLASLRYIDPDRTVPALINIHCFDKPSDMYQLYVDINNSEPVPRAYVNTNEIYDQICDSVLSKARDKWPNRFVEEETTNRNKVMWINLLKEAVFDIVDDSGFQKLSGFDMIDPEKTADMIVKYLFAFNQSKLPNHPKSHKYGFCLGYYRKVLANEILNFVKASAVFLDNDNDNDNDNHDSDVESEEISINVDNIVGALQKKWKSAIKKSDEPLLANINMTKLTNIVKISTEIHRELDPLVSEKQIQVTIIALNEYYMNVSVNKNDVWRPCSSSKTRRNREKAIQEKKFCLGLLNNYEQSYREFLTRKK